MIKKAGDRPARLSVQLGFTMKKPSQKSLA
jgi:hypothetical protein